MTEIAAQRGAAGAEWAGKTLCDALAITADRYGELPALSDRDGDGPWQTVSWAQTRQRALDLAAGFAELGLQPGEHVALMLPNRLEHVLADLGVLHAGGIPLTFYATLAPEQIAFMAGDCDATIARWGRSCNQLPISDSSRTTPRISVAHRAIVALYQNMRPKLPIAITPPTSAVTVDPETAWRIVSTAIARLARSPDV